MLHTKAPFMPGTFYVIDAKIFLRIKNMISYFYQCVHVWGFKISCFREMNGVRVDRSPIEKGKCSLPVGRMDQPFSQRKKSFPARKLSWYQSTTRNWPIGRCGSVTTAGNICMKEEQGEFLPQIKSKTFWNKRFQKVPCFVAVWFFRLVSAASVIRSWRAKK